MEPTPAVEPETPPTPAVEPEAAGSAAAVPPQATRVRSPQSPSRTRAAMQQRAAKPTASPKTARTSTMRDRVVRAEVGDETVAADRRAPAASADEPDPARHVAADA